MALIEMERARELVLAGIATLDRETVDLREALGRVLAGEVVASAPVPAFDSSAMDGFALRAADVSDASAERPVTLTVVGESRAGRPATAAVGRGEAIAISTGALLPLGADAILPIEQARRDDDHAPGQDGLAGTVQALRAVSADSFVRRAGEDMVAGQSVIARGALLGPAQLGTLAALGFAQIECIRRPRASIVTTGDELVDPGAELGVGQLYDANGYSLGALALQAGAVVSAVRRAPDDPERTRVALGRALEEADVTIISGGVSVGAHDHVKPSLAALGVQEVFWGVSLKPGKPTWFGRVGERLVFGLPGNPVSAMVTFALFVAPALRALCGAEPTRRLTTATITEPLQRDGQRTQAVRCRLSLGEHGWLASPTGHQGSHVLSSMLAADALAIVLPGRGSLQAGERVPIELLAGPGGLST